MGRDQTNGNHSSQSLILFFRHLTRRGITIPSGLRGLTVTTYTKFSPCRLRLAYFILFFIRWIQQRRKRVERKGIQLLTTLYHDHVLRRQS